MPSRFTRCLLGALLLCTASLIQAATLRVTTAQDTYDGFCNQNCSLRDAVATANREPGADVILLLAANYLISLPAPVDAQGIANDEDANLNGDLDVIGTLTIRGIGNGWLSRISGQTNDRLLEVRPGAKLTLDRVTLEGGNTAFNGGAVENHGQLVLSKVLVQLSNAVAPPGVAALEANRYRYGQGGGIANYANLDVRDSVFQDNRAEGSSAINLGRGGAVFNQGTFRLRTTTVRRNRVADPQLKGAGGGLYNLGSADVATSAFLENYGLRNTVGGAIANEGGQLKLTNSSLSGHMRGGLSNGYPDNPKGALAKATLVHVTIAGNAGFGVRNWADLRIRNSLFAGNFNPEDDMPTQGTNCDNQGSVYRYQATGLLLNDEPSNCRADLFVPFEQTYTTLMRSLFLDGDNGGPTKTYGLLPGSLAVDAAVGDCPNQDQRGFPRPVDGNGDGVNVCDLGAFELGVP